MQSQLGEIANALNDAVISLGVSPRVMKTRPNDGEFKVSLSIISKGARIFLTEFSNT